MQKLVTLIEELSDKGCTDIEAMDIVTDLLKVDLLKERLDHHLDKVILDETIEATKSIDDQSRLLTRMMSNLSGREKQCYLMHYIGLKSFGEVATELEICKGSVQQYIERAREKMKI